MIFLIEICIILLPHKNKVKALYIRNKQKKSKWQSMIYKYGNFLLKIQTWILKKTAIWQKKTKKISEKFLVKKGK